MKVEITSAVLEQIRALCVAESNEVCGLLLGAGRRIDAILPAANVASDPARHFELDPATLIAAHRAARAGGPAVIRPLSFPSLRRRCAITHGRGVRGARWHALADRRGRRHARVDRGPRR